jgi:3-oxoacyl-[acyl-carrier-protein] synthase-3
MLSDGAAAFLLSDTKNETGISLKVNWLEGYSYANELPTCMYMASDKLEDGTLKSYLDYTADEIKDKSILSIKQDVKLLGKNIVVSGVKGLKKTLQKHGVDINSIDYFLPHMSSEFFKSKIYDHLKEQGLHVPYEKWFINLSQVGNVGSASVYLMVDELFKSGKLKVGDKILLLVPESARFSYMFGLLTVC